jgi:hypothetical protein
MADGMANSISEGCFSSESTTSAMPGSRQVILSPASPISTEPYSPSRSRSTSPDPSIPPTPQQILNQARIDLELHLPIGHDLRGRFCPFTGVLLHLRFKSRASLPASDLEPSKHKKSITKEEASEVDHAYSRSLLTRWGCDWGNKGDCEVWKNYEPRNQLKRKSQLVEAGGKRNANVKCPGRKRKRQDKSVLTLQQADEREREQEREHTLSPHSELESKTGVDGGKQGMRELESVYYGRPMELLALVERKQARQQSPEPRSDTREEEGPEQEETVGCENVIDKRLASFTI